MASFILSSFADEASKAFPGQIEAMREQGIRLMEIRGVDGKSVSELTDEEAKAVRQTLAQNGMGLSALGSPYGKYPIEEDFGAHLDKFKRGLELCGLLGTDRIRMFSFFIPKGDDPAAWRNKVLDQLGQMLDLADEAGVGLYHENEKGIYGDTAERCLDLLTSFKGRLHGIFDPANFIQCGVDPLKAMEMLLPYIDYMHIKDALMADGAVVPAGKGDGHLPELLRAVAGKTEGMVLTLEPHLKVFDGLSGLQDEELRHHYTFKTSGEAYAAAAQALKDILTQMEYTEGGVGTWTR